MVKKLTAKIFQQRLLAWFDQHGRKNLPWQHNKTPYRVWVSEIMLQQTQVATVIPYYLKFMQVFPELSDLAKAEQDEVLHLWAGLGYYSRARNLQRAAQMVMQEFAGHFPDSLENLQKLPGIGASTAGAILSIAFNQRATILDGNVKRVLSRLHGITNPINDKITEKELWNVAQDYSPGKRTADYTQAIMDLGATFCTRSKPQCNTCPFTEYCLAHQQGMTDQIPQKKAGKKIPTREATFIIFKDKDSIFLQKRPTIGIWGGLWSLPEIAGLADEQTIKLFAKQQMQANVKTWKVLTPFKHTFSHYHLNLHPIVIEIAKRPSKIMEAGEQVWYKFTQAATLGLPKPIQTIIRELL